MLSNFVKMQAFKVNEKLENSNSLLSRLASRVGGFMPTSIFLKPCRGNPLIFIIDEIYQISDHSDKLYSWPPPPSPPLNLPTTTSRSPQH